MSRSRRRRAAGRATPRKAKSCIFCGDTGPLTDEHVFPEWLRQLGYTGDGWREVIDEDSQLTTRIEVGSPFNKKLKVLCASCNNEWGSQLEEAAKPILLQLFNADPHVKLNASSQQLLARWAFKTLCVINRVGSRSVIPEEHAHALRTHDTIPEGVQMWVGTASGEVNPRGEELVQARIIPRNAHITMPAGEHDHAFYQARFRLLNIFVDVAGQLTNDLTLEFSMDGDLGRALLPIYPLKHQDIWFPPALSLDVLGGIDGFSQIPLTGLPFLGHAS